MKSFKQINKKNKSRLNLQIANISIIFNLIQNSEKYTNPIMEK